MTDFSFLVSWAWVPFLLVAVMLYKFVLRFLFGMVIVPEDRIGLVTKKYVLVGTDRELPDGRILATKGEAGYQVKTLAPGLYWWMWPWVADAHAIPNPYLPTRSYVIPITALLRLHTTCRYSRR